MSAQDVHEAELAAELAVQRLERMKKVNRTLATIAAIIALVAIGLSLAFSLTEQAQSINRTQNAISLACRQENKLRDNIRAFVAEEDGQSIAIINGEKAKLTPAAYSADINVVESELNNSNHAFADVVCS